MEREYATAQKVYEMQEEAAEMVKDLQHALSKMSLVPKKQLHYIRSESDANESERAATLQELKEAKRELIYLQSEMQGIRAVNKKLRDHSAITNEELTKVQKEVLKLRQEKEDMCLQILKYESGGDERDTAAENIAELKTRLEKADVAMQKAFADLAAAQKGSADAEKLKEAERFNAELQDKLKSSEAEKQRVLTRLVVAQKEIDLLQEEDQTFTEREKEQYEAKRSRLITVIENQQVEIAKLQRELSAKRKEMTELRQELRDSGCAQQMLLHERKSWDEAHRELQLIIKMTKAELQDTKQDLAQAEGQKSKLQQELEAARVDIAGAEAKIDGLEQVLTNRNRDVMVLKKKLEVALTHSQAVAWEMKKHVEFQNLESKTNELASLQSQMQQEANTLLETQAALQEANRAYILTERLLVTERQTWLQANTELQNVINDLCAELNARTVELSQVRGQSGRKEIVRYVINPSASADLVLASNTSSAQRMRKVGSPFQLLETVQCV
jgi:chromosome segregation ATPase